VPLYKGTARAHTGTASNGSDHLNSDNPELAGIWLRNNFWHVLILKPLLSKLLTSYPLGRMRKQRLSQRTPSNYYAKAMSSLSLLCLLPLFWVLRWLCFPCMLSFLFSHCFLCFTLLCVAFSTLNKKTHGKRQGKTNRQTNNRHAKTRRVTAPQTAEQSELPGPLLSPSKPTM